MPSHPYEDREQTAVKHEILSRYLSAFVPIVGDWAADIAYIDCFAGPWASSDPQLGDTSFARAITVLRSTRNVLEGRGKHPTMRCLLIERDADAFERLKEYAETITDIEVSAKNWDFTEHIQDIVGFTKERVKSFPFFFIDPTGWEPLRINLIRPVLAITPGEILINLMTSWITRFLSDESKHFDRLLGEDWSKLLQLKGEELEEALVNSYAKSVRSAGQFNFVCTLPVMKQDQDAFHFYMIYATRNLRGVEVFKETEKHVVPFMHDRRAQAQERKRLAQSGQTSLFAPETLYRETRFTRHRIRSIVTAKGELERQLRSLGKIAYDEARGMVMQHSAVAEGDLREWLIEWKAQGLLAITNLRPGQKYPQKGHQQFLVWQRRR